MEENTIFTLCLLAIYGTLLALSVIKIRREQMSQEKTELSDITIEDLIN